MKINYYKIPEISLLTNNDINWDDLKIIVVTQNKQLNEPNDDFLTKILKSVNSGAQHEHQIINLPSFHALAPILINQPKRYLLIAFGISPQELNWQVNYVLYDLMPIRNIDLIFAHSVEDMSKDKNHKINLWNILKDYTFEQ